MPDPEIIWLNSSGGVQARVWFSIDLDMLIFDDTLRRKLKTPEGNFLPMGFEEKIQ